MNRAKHVEARRVVDDGGAFVELRIGKVRLQLTPKEAAESVYALMKIPEVQKANIDLVAARMKEGRPK